MASRRPLVNVSGSIRELPTGDTLPGVRELLTAARTYYVRTDGSDSNTGLSNTAGGAFATLQKAVSTALLFDFNRLTVTIQLGDGTYPAASVASGYINGSLVINGNAASPGNVVISLSSGSCITATDSAKINVSNMRLQTSGVSGLVASTGATVTGSNLIFGACGYAHIAAAARAQIIITDSCQIAGSAPAFANLDQANLDATAVAFTLSGSLAFSDAFIRAGALSYARMIVPTFSGTATGSRYNISGNSVINTNGAGETFFPGNAAGVKNSGGQYI